MKTQNLKNNKYIISFLLVLFAFVVCNALVAKVAFALPDEIENLAKSDYYLRGTFNNFEKNELFNLKNATDENGDPLYAVYESGDNKGEKILDYSKKDLLNPDGKPVQLLQYIYIGKEATFNLWNQTTNETLYDANGKNFKFEVGKSIFYYTPKITVKDGEPNPDTNVQATKDLEQKTEIKHANFYVALSTKDYRIKNADGDTSGYEMKTTDGLKYTYSFFSQTNGDYFVAESYTKEIGESKSDKFLFKAGDNTINYEPNTKSATTKNVPIESDYENVFIDTVDDFLEFAKHCSMNENYSKYKNFFLQNDLNFENVDDFRVGNFYGIFYGNNRNINGIKYTFNASNVGLFDNVAKDAKILGLNVEANLIPSTTNDKKANIGILAGVNKGRIEHCTVRGNIDGKKAIGGIVGRNEVSGFVVECKSYVRNDAFFQTGGIVGLNLGTVESCENFGDISNNDMEFSKDAGVNFYGGIVGYNLGKIKYCINNGKVGYLEDTSLAGTYIGGVAGGNFATLIGCTNKGQVAGEKFVGGIAGVYGEVPKLQDKTKDWLNNYVFNRVLEQQNYKLENPIPRDSILFAYNTNYGKIIAKQIVGGNIGSLVDTRTTDVVPDLNGADLPNVADVDIVDDAEIVRYSVFSSANLGDVLANSDKGMAGGIMGQSAVATIEDCYSNAIIEVPNAQNSYVGGIVGIMESGEIKNCFSFGGVKGNQFVGGIAGKANLINSCYSVAFIEAEQKNAKLCGVIAGKLNDFGKENSTNNFFVLSENGVLGLNMQNFNNFAQVDEKTIVSSNWKGFENNPNYVCSVENKTYFPKLQSFLVFEKNSKYITEDGNVNNLELRKIVDNENLLPYFQEEKLKKVLATENTQKLDENTRYTFNVVFKDGTKIVATVRVGYGETITTENIPEVPVKTGYTSQWESVDLANITKDKIVRVVFTEIWSTVASDGKKPQMLIEGNYNPGTKLFVEEIPNANLSGFDDFRIVKTYKFELTLNNKDLGVDNSIVRLKIPNGVQKPKVAITSKSGLVEVYSRIDGDYLVFEIPTKCEIAVFESQIPVWKTWWFYVSIVAAVLVVIVGSVITSKIVEKFKIKVALDIENEKDTFSKIRRKKAKLNKELYEKDKNKFDTYNIKLENGVDELNSFNLVKTTRKDKKELKFKKKVEKAKIKQAEKERKEFEKSISNDKKEKVKVVRVKKNKKKKMNEINNESDVKNDTTLN